MNLSRNSQNAAVLKIIKMSKNCLGRSTANHPRFLRSHSMEECDEIFTPPLKRIGICEPFAASVSDPVCVNLTSGR